MKVKQFAPNHTIVQLDDIISLFSYETKVVEINFNGVFLDPKYNYSKTTEKYVNKFLNVDSKTRDKRIKDKEYIIKPLN